MFQVRVATLNKYWDRLWENRAKRTEKNPKGCKKEAEIHQKSFKKESGAVWVAFWTKINSRIGPGNLDPTLLGTISGTIFDENAIFQNIWVLRGSLERSRVSFFLIFGHPFFDLNFWIVF